MWWLLVSCWFFVLIDFTESVEKIPYSPGTICNFEEYDSSQSKAINRYFCVSEYNCKNSINHSPSMHYEGCDRFMEGPNLGEKLVCCHQTELQEDLTIHYTTNFTYLPGVRSFMNCKHFSHAICGPTGSYCDVDVTEPEQFNGLPTAISKYPHTALIGYFHSTEKVWNWFCLGSIVSKMYILTAWTCMSDGSEPATNVKIGESRICHQDHCPDRDEEQNLKIVLKSRYGSDRPSRHDLAVIQVSPTISFNKNVRPACLYYEINTRQTQGWFARYGKPDTLIKTHPGERPLFLKPKDKKVIAFKVKTAGEARLTFSKTGLPYRKEFYYEIVLGAADNSESMITRSDAPNFSRPPTPVNLTTQILSSEQFRGFWINFQPHNVFVGKEDSTGSFLWYSDDAMDFNLSAMGISTPNFTGEWIINDYKTLASLHDFEMVESDADECKRAAGDDDSTFCAKSAQRLHTPCDNDWGGAIQIVEDEFHCMWQIFGVLMRDSDGPKNCSKVGKPSVFKLLNEPGFLAWIEDIIFPNFTITDICLEQPVCTRPGTALEGSCSKPLLHR